MYQEHADYEFSNQDIQLIKQQITKEYPITFTPIYVMVNGLPYRMPGIWTGDPPISNIKYLITDILKASFDGSDTDLLLQHIHKKKIGIIEALKQHLKKMNITFSNNIVWVDERDIYWPDFWSDLGNIRTLIQNYTPYAYDELDAIVSQIDL